MIQLTPKDLVSGREYLGLTQGELADALHVGRVNVSRYESGARQAPEHYCQALRELCEAKARPPAPAPVPVAPAPAGFLDSLNAPGGLKALAKNVDKLAALPAQDFESLTVRLNEVASTTYDEKLKVRALDILAKLELARAKVGTPGAAPTPAEAETSYDLSLLSDVEFALFTYLDGKARGNVQNPDLPWVKQATAVLTSLGVEP